MSTKTPKVKGLREKTALPQMVKLARSRDIAQIRDLRKIG